MAIPNRTTRRRWLQDCGSALALLPCAAMAGCTGTRADDSDSSTAGTAVARRACLYFGTADLDEVRNLGQLYLQTESPATALQRQDLAAELATQLDAAVDDESAVRIMEQRVQQDFLSLNIQSLHGWIASHTELTLASLC